MAQTLSHLCSATRTEAMLDHRTRIRALQRDRWIDYPRATEALQRLERLLNAPERERMPCLAMHGDSNIGKTLIVSKAGEVVESYTMLTLNADAHPLMSRMHKPDPKLGPDLQDKRSFVPIARADVDLWLYGSPEQAQGLIALAAAEDFAAQPLT